MSNFFTHIQKTIHIGLPLVGAQLLGLGMGTCDTIMCGWYGEEALAAVGLGTNLWAPIIVFAVSLIGIGQSFVAQAHGAGQARAPIVGQCVLIAVACTIVLSPCLLLMGQIVELVSDDPVVIRDCQAYLKLMIINLVPCLLIFPLRNFFDGIGRTALALIAGVFCLAANILANYTLIFGHFGFPEMGALGAAWASIIAHTVTFVILASYAWYHHRSAMQCRLLKPDWSLLKRLLRVGLPASLSFTIEVLFFAGFSVLVAYFGTMEVAANQIALNYISLMFMIPMGLGMAATTRVGQALGSGQVAEARKAAWAAIVVSVLFACANSTVLFFGRQSIVSLYTDEIELRQTAAALLLIAACFQIFDGMQATAQGALKGYMDTKIALINNTISYWIVGLGLGVWLAFGLTLGPYGLWYGFAGGLVVASVLHGRRLLYISTKQLE